jgi:sulfatase maturation enzyme AslB (radical SAM superfamily)
MKISAPYVELATNFAIDLWCVRTGSRRFRPLMTNFYVTKGCNLRCRYCYPPGDEPSTTRRSTSQGANRCCIRGSRRFSGGRPS